MTYAKSISLPHVLKIKKKLLNRIWRKYHWTLNRRLNSHLAFPKIYLQIILISCHVHEFINVNATFWLDAIPIFFLHLFLLSENSRFQMMTFPISKLLLACICTFGTISVAKKKHVLKNSWVVWMYIQFPIMRYSHIKVSMHHQA